MHVRGEGGTQESVSLAAEGCLRPMGVCVSRRRRDLVLKGIKDRHYSPLFYKGMAAAQAGRYTEAELCFHSVLFQSEVFLRYSGLLSRVEESLRRAAVATAVGAQNSLESPNSLNRPNDKKGKAKTGTEVQGRAEGCGNGSFLIDLNGAPAVDEERAAPPTLGGASVGGETESSDGRAWVVPFPVGKELEALLRFSQLQQDVEYVYTSCHTEKGHALGMVYACMNCAWQQLICYLMIEMRCDRANAGVRGEGDAEVLVPIGGEDPNAAPRVGRQRKQSKVYATDDDVEYALDMFEEMSLHFLINSSVNYGALALEYAMKPTKRERAPSQGSKASLEGKATLPEGHVTLSRQRKRICQNVADLCQLVIDMVWVFVERAPEEYINKVLLKLLPPRQDHVGEWWEPPAPPNDVASNRHSSQATDESETTHMLTALVEVLHRVGSRRDGGTFFPECHSLNPCSPIAFPFRAMRLPLRMVAPQTEGLLVSQLAVFESPIFHEAWHYTRWVLPPLASTEVAYPASHSFLLCKALPEHYSSEGEGKSARFSKHPIPDRQVPSAAYIDTLIEHLKGRLNLNDVDELSVFHGTESSGRGPTPNTNLDMSNKRMRNLVLMDETAKCIKTVYVLMSRIKKLMGDEEASRTYATAVVLQTGCLRGPDSADRVRMLRMVKSMGLL